MPPLFRAGGAIRRSGRLHAPLVPILAGLMERGDDRIALFTLEEIVPPTPFSVP